MGRLPLVLAALAVLVAATPPPTAAAPEPDYRCGQEPKGRFSWVEWGFCDIEPHGPERAKGLVIWNHGISGTQEQHRAPAALALRLLHRRGWDVIKIARNNLGEANRDVAIQRALERTLAEAKAQQARGYQRIVLAGQSFGGFVTLEAAASARVFGAVALAPGITVGGGGVAGRIDTSEIERMLQVSKAERLVLVFPPQDSLFDNLVRGPGALRALSSRRGPFLLVDETATEFSGHGGANGGRFALRYGPCLVDVLTAETPPAGRGTCPGGQEWAVARELLLQPWPTGTRGVRDAASLPPDLAPYGGLWFGPMGDSIIVTGLVEQDGGDVRLLYRSASYARLSGGIYAARVESGQLRATLGATTGPGMSLAPGPEGRLEMSWTPTGGSAPTFRGILRPAGPLE